MVDECRRYIFSYFDALPRKIMSWNKIHQFFLLKEMPENFQQFKYLSKNLFSSPALVVQWQSVRPVI